MRGLPSDLIRDTAVDLHRHARDILESHNKLQTKADEYSNNQKKLIDSIPVFSKEEQQLHDALKKRHDKEPERPTLLNEDQAAFNSEEMQKRFAGRFNKNSSYDAFDRDELDVTNEINNRNRIRRTNQLTLREVDKSEYDIYNKLFSSYIGKLSGETLTANQQTNNMDLQRRLIAQRILRG